MADSSNGATPEVLRWIASVVTMCAGLVLAARARARLIGWAFVVLVRLSDLDCDRVRQRRIRADGAEHRDSRRDPPQNFRRSAIAAVRHTGLTVLISDRYSATPRPIHGGIGVPATLLPRAAAEIRDRA